MKKFISLILSIIMIFTLSIPTFAIESNNSEKVEIITNKDEIKNILEEKGIYEEEDNIVTIIKYTPNLQSTSRQPKLGNDFYSKKIGYSTVSDSYPKYVNNYPPGSFQFTKQINTGWQVNQTLGLKVEILEAAIGYSLNKSIIETWTFNSINYSYPITVKAYTDYEKQYYDIYEKDLFYDDYIGRTAITREIGYTITVTKQ